MSIFACTAGFVALVFTALFCAVAAGDEAERADRNPWLDALLCAIAIMAVAAALDHFMLLRELALK